MSRAQLSAATQRVERVIQNARQATDPESKADLACLACIYSSARLEVACREYVSAYARNRSTPEVSAFVENKLYYFQNAKSNDIDNLLRAFSSDLAEAFRKLTGEEVLEAIDSVVNKKNELVHGKGAGLGLDTMERYHIAVNHGIEALRQVLTAPKK